MVVFQSNNTDQATVVITLDTDGAEPVLMDYTLTERDCQADAGQLAMDTELKMRRSNECRIGIVVAHPEGFEPPTYGFGVCLRWNPNPQYVNSEIHTI